MRNAGYSSVNNRIAGRMPSAIVYRLEMVEVDDHQDVETAEFARSWIIANALCRVVFSDKNTVIGYRVRFKSKRVYRRAWSQRRAIEGISG
jgi:hypothetical protein